VPERAGLNHPTIAPYGAYSCADGKAVLFSIQNEREWQMFCTEVLGDAAIAVDPRFDSNNNRVAARPALDEAINAVFSTLTRAQAVERLERARVAYGRVSTLEDVAAHPQNRYVDVETPTGPVRCLAPGAVVDGKPAEFRAVPGLGAHTEAVRAAFAPVPASA